jgi:anti-anti-sigma regulatory factor
MDANTPTPPPGNGQPNGDRLHVAATPETGYVKVDGRGSFKVSGALKQFAERVVDQGGSTLLVDLHDCIGMDSTFMGVLAGISQRLRKENNGQVVMTGASNKIVNLMTTLGLSRLVTILDRHIEDLPARLEALEQSKESPLQSAETMLEAHQNLVAIQEDNALRFQDVLDYLREDIQRHRT